MNNITVMAEKPNDSLLAHEVKWPKCSCYTVITCISILSVAIFSCCNAAMLPSDVLYTVHPPGPLQAALICHFRQFPLHPVLHLAPAVLPCVKFLSLLAGCRYAETVAAATAVSLWVMKLFLNSSRFNENASFISERSAVLCYSSVWALNNLWFMLAEWTVAASPLQPTNSIFSYPLFQLIFVCCFVMLAGV